MSILFYDDETLIEYEKQEQWDNCVKYLVEKMSSSAQNKNILYRLAAQSWYTLTFWDCNMPTERLDRSLFETTLESAYMMAQEKWWNDSDCLWLFGYFMCINQMDFPYVSTDIREVEKEGRCLINKAYLDNPYNPFAEILYLADNGKKHKYTKAKKKMKSIIGEYFSNLSAVDLYFSEIFTSTL